MKAASTDRPNNRKQGRIRIRMVKCNLGELNELSLGGGKVECHAFFAPRIGSTVRLMIEGLDRDIELDAKVKWAVRKGLRQHELGLEFVDVPAELKADLIQLARSAPLNGIYEHAQGFRRAS